MSDNPADSLRRELEAKLPIYHISRIWPLIEAALEAARADGEKLGRNNAARNIEAHRAKWAPMDGNMDQRRLSRHLGIAARVAQGPIDIEDVRVAFERAVSDGN